MDVGSGTFALSLFRSVGFLLDTGCILIPADGCERNQLFGVYAFARAGDGIIVLYLRRGGTVYTGISDNMVYNLGPILMRHTGGYDVSIKSLYINLWLSINHSKLVD